MGWRSCNEVFQPGAPVRLVLFNLQAKNNSLRYIVTLLSDSSRASLSGLSNSSKNLFAHDGSEPMNAVLWVIDRAVPSLPSKLNFQSLQSVARRISPLTKLSCLFI